MLRNRINTFYFLHYVSANHTFGLSVSDEAHNPPSCGYNFLLRLFNLQLQDTRLVPLYREEPL
jgi:hypothetical protein